VLNNYEEPELLKKKIMKNLNYFSKAVWSKHWHAACRQVLCGPQIFSVSRIFPKVIVLARQPL